jgi:hypothetical protein
MRIAGPAPVIADLKPRRNRGVRCIRFVRRSFAGHDDLRYKFLASGVVSDQRVYAAGGKEALLTSSNIEPLHHLATRSTKLQRRAAPWRLNHLSGLQLDRGSGCAWLREFDLDWGSKRADPHPSVRSCASDCANQNDSQQRKTFSETCFDVWLDVNWPVITPDASNETIPFSLNLFFFVKNFPVFNLPVFAFPVRHFPAWSRVCRACPPPPSPAPVMSDM